MKRGILILLLALLLCACTPSGTAPAAEAPPVSQPDPEPSPDADEPSPAPEPAADLAAVRDAMAEGIGASDWLPLDAAAMENLYGIDGAWVAQAAGFATMAGTFPDEVALVEAVDEDAAAQVAEKFQTRLDEVKVQAETYDPESYAKALECEVVTNGCFVRLLLSPKQSELADLYAQYIG